MNMKINKKNKHIKQEDFEKRFCDFLVEYRVLTMSDELRNRLKANWIDSRWAGWDTRDYIWYSWEFTFERNLIEIDVEWCGHFASVTQYKFDKLHDIYKRLDKFLEEFKETFIRCREECKHEYLWLN